MSRSGINVNVIERAHRLTDRQTDGQAVGQTGRLTDGKTDKQEVELTGIQVALTLISSSSALIESSSESRNRLKHSNASSYLPLLINHRGLSVLVGSANQYYNSVSRPVKE